MRVHTIRLCRARQIFTVALFKSPMDWRLHRPASVEWNCEFEVRPRER